jgi:hypothetical protein
MALFPASSRARAAIALIGLLVTGAASAQTAKPAEPAVAPAAVATEAKAPGPEAFAALAWLEGCWRGTVAEREYNEHWLPPRGQMMVGASHTALNDRTQSFEYLRIEVRPEGVFYVAAPFGKKEVAFRLVGQSADTTAGRNDQIFTFANPAEEFPARIIYRRASEGWLYATVEGKIAGADKQLVYPMRRVGCESGEFLRR